MSKYKVNVDTEPSVHEEPSEHHDAHQHHHEEHAAHEEHGHAGRPADDILTSAAAIGVVAVGAIIFEAALIPGIALGVAAALAPKYLPKLGDRVQPLIDSTVRGAYKFTRKARATVSEYQERMQDIAAEIHSDEEVAAAKVHASNT
jgi:hypothetical protein